MAFPLLVLYRTKQWDIIAESLRVEVKHSLERYVEVKAFYANSRNGSSYRSGTSRRDREYEALRGPVTHLTMLLQLQDKEASDAVLKSLGSFSELGRVDNSELVMDLVNNDPSSFFWALDNGWGKGISLLITRQHKLVLMDVVKAAIKCHKTDTLDSWIRLWSKRNPSIQRFIQAPTMAECQWCVCEEGILPAQVLNKLLQEEANLGNVIESWKALGCWDVKTPEVEKAALIANTIPWINIPTITVDPIEDALFDSD